MKALVICGNSSVCSWVVSTLDDFKVDYTTEYTINTLPQYDLIVIELSDATGLETLEALKKLNSVVPRIVMLSGENEELLDRALLLGAHDFIRMPFTEIAFKLRVNAVVSRVKTEYFRNAVLEALPDITFIVNNKLKTIYFKQNRTDMFRHTEAEAIGMSPEEYFENDVGKLFANNIRHVLDDKSNLEFHYTVTIDGRPRWRSAILVYYENSEPKVIGIVRDHTDLVNAYTQNERQHEYICSMAQVAINLKQSASDLILEGRLLELLADKARRRIAEDG